MRRIMLAFILLCFVQAYAKDPIPEALLNAKTALVKNGGASEKDFNKLNESLKKWGRFELVEDRKSADIVITLSTGLGIRNMERPGGSGAVQSLQVQVNYLSITSARDDSKLWNDETPGYEKNPDILVSSLKRKLKNK